jgi:hypothetical protein
VRTQNEKFFSPSGTIDHWFRKLYLEFSVRGTASNVDGQVKGLSTT